MLPRPPSEEQGSVDIEKQKFFARHDQSLNATTPEGERPREPPHAAAVPKAFLPRYTRPTESIPS
jgi:hypothetical protein